MTLTEKTTYMTLESGIKEDATSGRENLLKKLYIQCICVKISIMTYVKN